MVIGQEHLDMTIRGAVVHLSGRRLVAVATRRATATTVVERTASVILPVGGPRIAQSAHRGTKPQKPCSDQFRSASLSYRPTLAAAAFCNPIAPAHSCRDARPQIPPTSSPTTIARAAPPFFGPFPYNAATSLQRYREVSVLHGTMCRRSLNTTKRMKVLWTTTYSMSAEGLGNKNGKEPGLLETPALFMPSEFPRIVFVGSPVSEKTLVRFSINSGNRNPLGGGASWERSLPAATDESS